MKTETLGELMRPGLPRSAARDRGPGRGERAGRQGAGDRGAVLGEPDLTAARLGLVAERAVGAVVAGHGGEEVVGLVAVRVGGLAGLLAVEAALREVAVADPARREAA